MNSERKIQYECFRAFIKGLEFNNPLVMPVSDFYFSMREKLDLLKKEILNNLIHLGSDQRKLYLNELNYQLENLKENILPEDLIDADAVEQEFFNHYYGFYLNSAIGFIYEQFEEVEPKYPLQNIVSDPKKRSAFPPEKLKTNLSVPQIILFFKLLANLKPPIFDVPTDAELLRFISANIESKKSGEGGISISSMRNLLNKPDSKALDFWEKHFHTMLAKIRKLK